MKPQFHALILGTIFFWGAGLVAVLGTFAFNLKNRSCDGGLVRTLIITLTFCMWILTAVVGVVVAAVTRAASSKAGTVGDGSTTHFGFRDVPVDEKKALVGEVFSNVADMYDVMNDLMSAGVHRVWKDQFVRALDPTPGMRMLDVAGGTGDIAFRCLDHAGRKPAGAATAPAKVTVCDINEGMLGVGRERAAADGRDPAGLEWVQGDAEALPFEDNTFDSYTISFGIRNTTDVAAALRESYRVLRPGGRFLCLEFSRVALPVLSQAYDAYSFQLIPLLGELVANDRDSYQYLVESIRQFPDQETFKAMIDDAGFRAVSYSNLSFGIAAMHSGFKLYKVQLRTEQQVRMSRKGGESYWIGGVNVKFPFKAYPSQMAMMAKVIKAVAEKKNALLESPTGSGKSLALLCSTLAWQREVLTRRAAARRRLREYRLAQTVRMAKSAVAHDELHNSRRRPTGPHPPPPPGPSKLVDLLEPSAKEPLPGDDGDGDATPQPGGGPLPAQPPPGLGDNQATAMVASAEPQPGRTTMLSSDDDFMPGPAPPPLPPSPPVEAKPRASTPPPGPPAKRAKLLSGSFKGKGKVSNSASESRGEDAMFDSGDAEADKQARADAAELAQDPPRIYFASRTHSQVHQIVGELRATAYRPRMAILASREQYCIHPRVSKSARRNDECKALLEHAGCGFNHNVQRLASDPVFSTKVWDIENLVSAGRRKRGCPYFASKNLAETADIVFCPYNYLVDPLVRGSMSIALSNAIVILDEAHNIEDSCRDAGSAQLTLDSLDHAQKDLDAGRKTSDTARAAYEPLLVVIDAVLGWLRNTAASSLRGVEYEVEESPELAGRSLLAALEQMGLTPSSLVVVRAALKSANDIRQEKSKRDSAEGGPRDDDNTHVLTAETFVVLETLLFVVDICVRDDGVHAADYVMLVRKVRKAQFGRGRGGRGGGRGGRGGRGGGHMDSGLFSTPNRHRQRRGARSAQRAFASSPLSAVTVGSGHGGASPGSSGNQGGSGPSRSAGETGFETSLNFWCMNPGIVFNSLAGESRSVILTSGTLSPLDSFESELMAPFPIVLEAGHVIDMEKQVFVTPLVQAPSGYTLNSTWKHSNTLEFQDQLGETVKALAHIVPHGMLVFVTSYTLLDKLVKRWKETGLYAQLSQLKRVVQEPRAKADFEGTMAKFYAAIKGSKASPPTIGGAVLLAVYRGKVSEGIDFSDDNARSVLCVGIPYPNIKDRKITIKRRYNDTHSTSRGLLPGSKWYTLQAFRALNQALGRCIRHRNDYGSILLVDERFARSSIAPSLSKWVRTAIQSFPNPQAFGQALHNFHSAAAEAAEQRAAAASGKPAVVLELDGDDESGPAGAPSDATCSAGLDDEEAKDVIELGCRACGQIVTTGKVPRGSATESELRAHGWQLRPSVPDAE
ncbi:uncharacterized protein AMSG_11882 [Thecamonas trahens ATCC 50062]|uniref:2-methoxy-6-polyprenyl-1,4-benzoquinol methylase, mitochondrial n=1 Tax=Thecamonas trahens ATCC 50062 TaxID=461836 RepID=A0A0L0DAS5_THETB|nr:hypothetical protein AMSG_11882 [Thecamonas trahens ATCC 50062]KNC49459.1 hypothetical protein AMSG_11882 [Thecamonas trahens ATCC 50062]|eukprot:XP_013757923.1 hypothetical protein AMSG_11882 [Thecamonas trahens ATCC 50062]